MDVRYPAHRFFIALTISAVCMTCAPAVEPDSEHTTLRERLRLALAKEDATAICDAVADINRHLGPNAGVPEVPDTYMPIPRTAMSLTATEASRGFEPFFPLLEKLRWWKIGLDPTTLGHPLREPAAVLSGNVAACRGKLDGADRSLAFAKEAGDFLIWAQDQAGSGVFPFPASRGVSQAAPFLASERHLTQAAKEGWLESVRRNGWVIDDERDGGLQFDNGECGVALLELYELTTDRKYLDAATRSADCAVRRPLVPNWNYNSFSVYLLARTHRVTRQPKYLEAATKKALLGVIPGQLTAGPHTGRWNDAHNARPAYHFIMLRSLTELLMALPGDDTARPTVLAALRRGLAARNKDFLDQGAPNKDKAMEVLLVVNRVFASDQAFLQETLSADALDSLIRLVSDQARRGGHPLGPREWGHFLEYVVWRGGD